jgi:hypothetical protein
MAKQIDPKNVVGRDDLITQIWRQLQKPPEQGSLRFTAERRIGKTTVMTKMAAEPMDGFDLLFLEVEGIESPDRFTGLLLNRAKPLLPGHEKAKSSFDDFWVAIGGTELGGIIKLPEKSKLGWQATLEKTIEGLCQHRPDNIVLLMFDELPYMLQNIAATTKADGDQHEALTILDTLRSLRQRHVNLRMIFASSVGLHHVLRGLKQTSLASEPVNNMPLIEIHPLEVEHALRLANHLLAAEQLTFTGDDQDLIPERLMLLADRVPFYMERIAGELGLLGRPISLQDVNSTVQRQFTSDRDPWEMDHFRDRIDIYYHGSVPDANGQSISKAQVARHALDHFAVTDEPQTIDQVWGVIRSQLPLADRQVIVQLLKSLGQDHYLTCDTEKRYSFRFPLIQQWWKMAQGLGS